MTSENASSQPTDAPAGGSSGADTFSEMVGTIDDFAPGFMKLAKIAGRRVVVAGTNSGIHAFDNACPDQGYGLATGSLDGEVITCQWHNWKFDVATGTCLRGEQDVASHPISIRGNEVWVSVTEPSDADKRAALWPSLRRGIEADYVGQIARDTARLLEAGAEPADIVWEAIAVGAPKADYGIGHELAAAADCLAMVDMFDGLDRTLPLTHAIAGIAEETRDRPAYVPSAPRPGDFLAAVEAEQLDAAVSALRAEVGGGATPAALAGLLIEAVSQHHLSYGHGLIYTQKTCELLDRVGWHRADELLPHLVSRIVWSTREDSLPYMAKAMRLIEQADLGQLAAAPDHRDTGWDDQAALAALFLEADVVPVAEACAAALGGAGIEGVLDAVTLAVSQRMLRYDTSTESRPDRDFRWLDISHGLTYSRAARWAWRQHQSPASARLALFTVFLCFDTGRYERRYGVSHSTEHPVGGAVTGTDDMSLIEAIVARDPAAAVRIAQNGSIDDVGRQLALVSMTDAAGSFIVAAHLVKMARASWEEAIEIGSNLPLMATARLAAAPRQERFVASAVAEAVDFVRTGTPPVR